LRGQSFYNNRLSVDADSVSEEGAEKNRRAFFTHWIPSGIIGFLK
jgi:hypothetical protein